jgi:HK97 family phage major capsid protein/HK97 family phage prohead protease
MREVRTVGLAAEVRAAEDGAGLSFSGHAAVFNEPTWIGSKRWGFWEQVDPGFFRNVLEDDAAFLVNHDPNIVLARNGKTMTLSVDDRGLVPSAEFDSADPEAVMWAGRVRRGDVSQMSFAFTVSEEKWGVNDADEEVRTLLTAERLYDVSIVTYPAYPGTDAAHAGRRRGGRPPAPRRPHLGRGVPRPPVWPHGRPRAPPAPAGGAQARPAAVGPALPLPPADRLRGLSACSRKGTSMPSTQQLREQRANAWSQLQEIMAVAEREGRDLSAEEREKYDRGEADLDRLGDDISRQERHEERSGSSPASTAPASCPRPRPTSPDGLGDPEDQKRYDSAFGSWMRRGNEDLSREERSALRSGWVDGAELRAAGVATGGAGGYTVPPAFRAKLVEAMTFVAPMRQYAEVITTDTGANLPWPTVDDTANEGAILAENTQVSEQDFVFGQASLDAYMYTSKLVRVSFQLLNDNAFNLEAYLARALGQRIGRIQNRHFTVGTGTGQPDGIVTSARRRQDRRDRPDHSRSPTTTSWTCPTPSTRRTRQPALDALAVRAQGHPQAQGRPGRPLWEPSVQAGVPDTLLGYPLVLNNLVPAIPARTQVDPVRRLPERLRHPRRVGLPAAPAAGAVRRLPAGGLPGLPALGRHAAERRGRQGVPALRDLIRMALGRAGTTPLARPSATHPPCSEEFPHVHDQGDEGPREGPRDRRCCSR